MRTGPALLASNSLDSKGIVGEICVGVGSVRDEISGTGRFGWTISERRARDIFFDQYMRMDRGATMVGPVGNDDFGSIGSRRPWVHSPACRAGNEHGRDGSELLAAGGAADTEVDE
jgi:hypothetical protein